MAGNTAKSTKNYDRFGQFLHLLNLDLCIITSEKENHF